MRRGSFLYKKTIAPKSIIIYTIIIIGCVITSYKKTEISSINEQIEKIENNQITIVGKITSIPYEENNNTIFEIETKEVSNIKKKTKFIIYTNKSENYLHLGDTIELSGTIRTITGFKNSRTFNYKKYMNYKSVFGNIFASKIVHKSNNSNCIRSLKSFLNKKINSNFER